MKLIRFTSIAIIGVVFLLIAFMIVLVFLQAQAIDAESEAQVPLLLRFFEANVWVDFAATFISALAVFLLVMSVMMQGKELREQRAEMRQQSDELRKQADALTQQSTILIRQTEATEKTLRLAMEQSSWEKIRDLMEDLRSLIHLRADASENQIKFKTFQARGRKWKLAYSPRDTDDSDQWTTPHFLGRAAQNVSGVCKIISDALDKEEPVDCPPARNDFDLMARKITSIDALAQEIPDHMKTSLQEMRLEEWKRNMEVVQRAFETKADKGNGVAAPDKG